MKKQILLFLTVTILLLAGCGKSEPDPMAVEEGVYQIYYLNASLTKLVPIRYVAHSTDSEQLVEELMEQILSVPQDVDCQAALSEKVLYQGSKLEGMVLYLYFDNNYTSMKPYREILGRASLVKTLTQIEGIDYISIYSGDQPLLDSKGSPVGMLSSSDFIDSISDVNAFEKTELTLYFTDAAGEKLIEEKREVVHDINTSLEKLAVEELIAGPEQAGAYPALSRDINLLNVTVNENVCYLNFDATFLGNSIDVKDYIPIYSIVNTLSELSTVNKVQITVNGSADVMFRDSISLNTQFERNLDYIGGN